MVRENEDITNKVAQSGLVTIDLEEWYPEGERLSFDIKGLLFQGMILKEKDFREFIKTEDWTKYKDKYVAITCSADAIVPTWAYMLLTTAIAPHAKKVIFGSVEMLERVIFGEIFEKMDRAPYTNARVVIKGCSKKPIPVAVYVELMNLLLPVAKSIMYGEPCST